MNTQTDITPLINIMNELREKCPWDKKQTFTHSGSKLLKKHLNLQMR